MASAVSVTKAFPVAPSAEEICIDITPTIFITPGFEARNRLLEPAQGGSELVMFMIDNLNGVEQTMGDYFYTSESEGMGPQIIIRQLLPPYNVRVT